MIDFFLDPFKLRFMQNAFLVAIIISVPTAMLSCYLVLKGWSLMGDAISHAVLPGIVLAYIFKIPLIIGAFVAGLFCSFTSSFISENSRIKKDTVLGVVFSGMFGVGLVLITKVSTNLHLNHILFGNILGITNENLILTVSISFLVSFFLFIKRKDLMLFAFDEIQSNVIGISNKYLNVFLISLTSITVVATLSSVGIILSIGLLITPGAIVFLLTNKFDYMMILSVLITSVSAFLGVYASFYLDSSPAPTIILILSFIFFVILVFKTTNKKEFRKKYFKI
tara:strand:+ start:947 stop:1789 length:843 start_codon:yes stop_codon:yes gene_type:complete